MKNNIKKAPVKFGKTCCIFSILCRFLSLPQISDYHHLKLGFDIVNFPFLDGDVPRSASYGIYISQLIRFARVSSHVNDFNNRNKVLTAKLLRQGYRYHKLRKAFVISCIDY